MDLNYLFHRQQVERSRAKTATTEEAREAHEELARQYEEQIERLAGAEFSFPKWEESGHRGGPKCVGNGPPVADEPRQSLREPPLRGITLS